MCALYAFLRQTDDLGDNAQPVEQRKAALERWREQLQAALAGHEVEPTLVALADTVATYHIPQASLTAVIDGVAMDLAGRKYETFDELANYCEHVASAVGTACIHIWGFSGGTAALDAARSCGIAFQLTNILRDLREDALAGRVYLPNEDLLRFNYTVDDLRRGVVDDRLRALMRFEIARAREYYARAWQLERHLTADGRHALAAMITIYEALLDEISHRDGDVFTRPVRLSSWRKMTLLARSLLPRWIRPRSTSPRFSTPVGTGAP
jgi:phytoene synthase